MRNHGHAKSHATTTELMKKANALSPKIAFVFTTEHYYARHTPNENRDKPRQGVVANTLNAFGNGAVGFINWLDRCLALHIAQPQALAQRPYCLVQPALIESQPVQIRAGAAQYEGAPESTRC